MGFLKPEIATMLWTLVTFVLLLAVLWRFAWGPLMKALQDREERIAKRIGDAEAMHKQALGRVAEYERKIAAAKDEAAEIIAEGKRDVEKVREEIMADAQAEAAKAMERAKREILLAKESAIQDLREQMVTLTAQLAGRVIRREVNAEDHRRFVEDAVAEVGKTVK